MRYFNPGFVVHPPLVVTWNNNDKSANITLSGGLLTATSIATGDLGVRGTFARAAGKWYFEVNMTTVTGGDTSGGLATATPTFAQIGANATQAYVQYRGGNIYKNGVVQYGNGSMAGGGILRVAYDANAHLAWLAFASGNWNASGAANPATGVGGNDVSAFDTGGLYPVFTSGANADSCTVNFGGSSFSFTPPAGFTAWNG